MNTIFKFILKYKDLISYAFFGVWTTVINIVTYYLLYNIFEFSNVLSNCIAWVVAVVFAYITNKLYVFNSKSFKFDLLLKEVISFFGCRFLTGVLDVVIMYLAVDVYSLNSTVWKIISNILVIIINFIAGKLVVFKK